MLRAFRHLLCSQWTNTVTDWLFIVVSASTHLLLNLNIRQLNRQETFVSLYTINTPLFVASCLILIVYWRWYIYTHIYSYRLTGTKRCVVANCAENGGGWLTFYVQLKIDAAEWWFRAPAERRDKSMSRRAWPTNKARPRIRWTKNETCSFSTWTRNRNSTGNWWIQQITCTCRTSLTLFSTSFRPGNANFTVSVNCDYLL